MALKSLKISGSKHLLPRETVRELWFASQMLKAEQMLNITKSM